MLGDVCLSIERVTRSLRIGDVRVSAELDVETWDDGVICAKIVGTALYGEGADVEAAVADLEGNVNEELAYMIRLVAKNTPLGGAAKQDWDALHALMAQ